MDYREEENRRIADERIRAYVGERLAEIPSDRLEGLSAEQRERYDRLLLRCEFLNQAAFHTFLRDPTAEAKTALASADEQLKSAADALVDGSRAIDQVFNDIEAAFDNRDAAMQHP